MNILFLFRELLVTHSKIIFKKKICESHINLVRLIILQIQKSLIKIVVKRSVLDKYDSFEPH